MSKNRASKNLRRTTVTPQANTIVFDTQHNTRSDIARHTLVPKSRNQEQLILSLQDSSQHIVVAVGPAGTGKTYLAMMAAIQALRSRSVDRIVLTRPAVGVEDERHGFLPGGIIDKMEPWTRPMIDVLREHYRANEINTMINDQVIEIAPLAFMRGRTFRNCWVIADEMQNATPAQIKMLLTRIGNNSRIVVTGDVEQTDKAVHNNGLINLCDRLRRTPVNGIALCSLGDHDIQRHSLIRSILELYSV